MSKVVQISTNADPTDHLTRDAVHDPAIGDWHNLPGSQGSFSVTGEEIDDTILGQTFQSNLTGLVDWKVESDGIYKGFPGYLAEIMKQGTPTASTDEAMTREGDTATYAIVNGERDMWDRRVTVVVSADSAVVNANQIVAVDYLFGRVTLKSDFAISDHTSVTVDVTYLPTLCIGKANSYTLTMSAAMVDESHFKVVQANDGTKICSSGLRTVGLELQGIFDPGNAGPDGTSDNMDDVKSAKVNLTDRDELIIQVDPAGDGSSVARGFFRLTSAGQGGSVGALEDETVSFSLNVPFGALINNVFNWRHIDTTLAPSIQHAIASFLLELNTYQVRYLPQGAIGQMPMNGIQGEMMLTDISLAGGLSNMNMFNISMQGNGRYTVV